MRAYAPRPNGTAKASLGFVATPGNTGNNNASASQETPAFGVIVALVGVHLVRPLARPAGCATESGQRLNSRAQHFQVVSDSATEQADKGKAYAVDDQMALGVVCPLSVGFGPVSCPREGTVSESMAKRRQANRLAHCICARSTTWSRSHTPAFFHCRSQRQQVMPYPQPISWGSFSQGMPVSRMKRMPRRVCLSLRRGLLPWALAVLWADEVRCWSTGFQTRRVP